MLTAPRIASVHERLRPYVQALHEKYGLTYLGQGLTRVTYRVGSRPYVIKVAQRPYKDWDIYRNGYKDLVDERRKWTAHDDPRLAPIRMLRSGVALMPYLDDAKRQYATPSGFKRAREYDNALHPQAGYRSDGRLQLYDYPDPPKGY